MTADTRARQADALHPICKTPVWLRNVQTLRRRQVWSGDLAPTWPEACKGKHSQSSLMTPPCPLGCLWPRCCPRDGNYFCCPSVKSAACLCLTHIQVSKALQDPKQERYKVKILLFYSPSDAKGGEKGIINSCRQSRRLLCSTPVL